MKNSQFRAWTAIAALLAMTVATAGVQAPQQEHKIYPEGVDAKASIQRAVREATKSHKRIILDFGGNWCGDCRALDANFHKEANRTILNDSFILVDINIGHFDLNKDIAALYEVPLEKGVPALAILDSKGHLLFSQKKGEFESMRTMDPASVTAFLTKWKG